MLDSFVVLLESSETVAKVTVCSAHSLEVIGFFCHRQSLWKGKGIGEFLVSARMRRSQHIRLNDDVLVMLV